MRRCGAGEWAVREWAEGVVVVFSCLCDIVSVLFLFAAEVNVCTVDSVTVMLYAVL